MDMFQPRRPHFSPRSLDVSRTWSMILLSAGTTGVSLVLCRTNKNGCCPLLKGAKKPNLLLQSISSSGIYIYIPKMESLGLFHLQFPLNQLFTLDTSQVPVKWRYPPPSPNPPTTVKHHRHPIKGVDHCLRNCVAPQEFLFSQLWIQNQNCMQHNF